MFQIARAGRGRRFSFRPGLACPGGLVAYPRGAPTRQVHRTSGDLTVKLLNGHPFDYHPKMCCVLIVSAAIV